MSKRKSRESESRPPSPAEVSSCSSSCSKTYSSKMSVHEGAMSAKEDNEQYEKAVTKEMVLVGCPRCFMYVMSSEVEPKCPKCNTSVFLDLFT